MTPWNALILAYLGLSCASPMAAVQLQEDGKMQGASAAYKAEYEDTEDVGTFWEEMRRSGRHTPIPRAKDDSGRVITWPLLLVLGAQKGGITNLRWNLMEHPLIGGAQSEVHFFNAHGGSVKPPPRDRIGKLLGQYTRILESRSKDGLEDRVTEGQFVIDVSSHYAPTPAVPYRLRAVLPHIRMVLLLRDPVDRYFSAMRMYVCGGYALDDFHVAGAAAEHVAALRAHYTPYEKSCRAPDANLQDLKRCKLASRHGRALVRGLYAEQLERWYSAFNPQQILVIESSELFTNFVGVLNRVTAFAGLPPHAYMYDPAHQRPNDCPQEGQDRYKALEAIMEAAGDEHALRDFYYEHNERLFQLMGVDYGWNRKYNGSATRE